MRTKCEIKQAADGQSWNLYVNGHIAVSYESMQVCDNIKEALEKPGVVRSYSEGAEIADVIRKSLDEKALLRGIEADWDHSEGRP